MPATLRELLSQKTVISEGVCRDMNEFETRMWGIHAGDLGQADGLFKKNFVALGWEEISDLSKLTADREAFKKIVAETYPDAKPGVIPNYAGQLFRFVHEMKIGDFVIY